jgi:hypothetical protein
MTAKKACSFPNKFPLRFWNISFIVQTNIFLLAGSQPADTGTYNQNELLHLKIFSTVSFLPDNNTFSYKNIFKIVNLHFFTFRHHHIKPTNQRASQAGRESAGLVWKSGTEETT